MVREASQIVTLTLDKHGLRSDPQVLHVERGEIIGWEASPDLPMMIQCIESTPFAKAEYQAEGYFEEPVRTDAPPGVYRFASAFWRDGKVYMDSRCPRFIIQQ